MEIKEATWGQEGITIYHINCFSLPSPFFLLFCPLLRYPVSVWPLFHFPHFLAQCLQKKTKTWSIVDSQCCLVSGGCAAKWFSWFFSIRGYYKKQNIVSCATQSILLWLSILHTLVCICIPNFQFSFPFFPLVTMFVSVCESASALQVSAFVFVLFCFVLFVDSTYKQYHIILGFLSLTYFT